MCLKFLHVICVSYKVHFLSRVTRVINFKMMLHKIYGIFRLCKTNTQIQVHESSGIIVSSVAFSTVLALQQST